MRIAGPQRLAGIGGMLRLLTGVAGAALTVYVTLALFGFVRSSSQHYAAFAFAVMFMAGPISVRAEFDQRVLDPGTRWFRTRRGSALAGFLLAFAGRLYILYQAKRLDVADPYFNTFEMAGGLL